MPGPRYPRDDGAPLLANLREVAPSLHVGSEGAVTFRAWAGIVALNPYEESPHPEWRVVGYVATPWFIYLPMDDGDPFAPGVLDQIDRLVASTRPTGPVLLHCRLGLSRSASAAYAMLRVQDRLSHEEALRRVQVPPWTHVISQDTLGSARRWAEARLAGRPGSGG